MLQIALVSHAVPSLIAAAQLRGLMQGASTGLQLGRCAVPFQLAAAGSRNISIWFEPLPVDR
jgi:hypothetical protein